MMVHKRTQVLVTVEMTEEQSTSLRSALRKVNEYGPPGTSAEVLLSKEEAEVIDDLRQSLLNL